MGNQNCGASTKAEKRPNCKNIDSIIPSINAFVNLLVCGEAPQEASQDVSHPEESVNQHRFVVLVAHPVVLEQNGDTYMDWMSLSTSLVMVGKILVWSKFQLWLQGVCFSFNIIELKLCLEKKRK